MSQRMTIGAVVLLIAASGVIPHSSPEMAALAGSYTLISRPDVNQRLTLVLVKDGSARLTTEALVEKPASTTQMGVWTVEGGAVKLALTASSGAGKRQMTLSIQEDSLVGIENDSISEGGENWTFRRR
ncbi:MAG TPA: hypothetical protein VK747_01280 [Blastocatellia bacterium]|nr:hypothetical protein [Blastocatellia bacterium]